MTDDRMLALLPKMFFPGKAFTGPNSLFYLRTLKGKTLAVVSGSAWKSHEDRLKRFLPKDCGMITHHGEPKKADVDSLHAEIAGGGYETVIGIGGGSVMDLAKTARLRKEDSGLILVPTTSGTGAEVSRYAVITENAEKKSIESARFMPDTILLDPTFLKTLPAEKAVYNNLDSISSVIEAVVSKMANPLSDALSFVCLDSAIPAIRSVAKGKAEDKDFEALQIAGFLNGLVIGSSSVGLVHAFAHHFGARLDIPHGVAIGAFMLPVIKHSAGKTDRFGKLEKSEHLRGDVIGNIERLLKDVNFLDYHRKLDLASADVSDACEKIMADSIIKTNPYPLTEEDIREILRSMGVG
jgi:alcohol dehydrogenase class IV